MISFVAFSLRRAWQGFWRNAVMSLAATATMVFMLVMLAGFYVVLTGLNAGLEFVEDKVQVVADVKTSATTPAIEDLAARTAALPEVARAYGVINEALGCANRASFVIDKGGKVTATFASADLGTPRAKSEYDAALANLS